MRKRSRGQVAGFLASVLGGGLSAFVYLNYRRDLRRSRERVSAGSRRVETPCGPIEYGIGGDGSPVLAVHGAGGGFDQGLEVGEPLVRRGFRVLAMSRFGYLRTPLSADASPSAQADAHACLLDALGIERVAVVGASAGAPSSMQFALRYPERTAALVLLVPAAYPFEVEARPEGAVPDRTSAAVKLIFDLALDSDFLWWVASKTARSSMVRGALGTPSAVYQSASAEEHARIARVLDHIQPVSMRRLGLLNDLSVLRSLPRYDLERIVAPTLVIGVADCLYGTYAAARYTAENIPGARFVGYETGGHLWAGHQEEVAAEIVDFLKVNALKE